MAQFAGFNLGQIRYCTNSFAQPRLTPISPKPLTINDIALVIHIIINTFLWKVDYFSTSHLGSCLEPTRWIYPLSLKESNALCTVLTVLDILSAISPREESGFCFRIARTAISVPFKATSKVTLGMSLWRCGRGRFFPLFTVFVWNEEVFQFFWRHLSILVGGPKIIPSSGGIRCIITVEFYLNQMFSVQNDFINGRIDLWPYAFIYGSWHISERGFGHILTADVTIRLYTKIERSDPMLIQDGRNRDHRLRSDISIPRSDIFVTKKMSVRYRVGGR